MKKGFWVTGKKVENLSMVKRRVRDGGGVKGGAKCFFDSFCQSSSGEFFNRGILVTEHNMASIMGQPTDLGDKSLTSILI